MSPRATNVAVAVCAGVVGLVIALVVLDLLVDRSTQMMLVMVVAELTGHLDVGGQ